MSWLSDIFSSSTGELVGQIGSAVEKLSLKPDDKQSLKMDMHRMVQQRESAIEEKIRGEIQTKEQELVKTLQQGDSYTKRARPSVVYAGLVFIFFNYVLVPTIQSLAGADIQAFDLPVEFWAAWGGIVATWTIGRTAEKRGASNKMTRTITGSTPVSLLDEGPAKG